MTHPPESNAVDDERHGPGNGSEQSAPTSDRVVNTPCDGAKDQDSAVTAEYDPADRESIAFWMRTADEENKALTAMTRERDHNSNGWDQALKIAARYLDERDAAIKRAEAAEAEGAVLFDLFVTATNTLAVDNPDEASALAATYRHTEKSQAQALLDRVRGMEANQRTAGTVEICPRDDCRDPVGAEGFGDHCWKKNCPIRAASAISKSAAGGVMEDDDYQDDDYELADPDCCHNDFDHDWDGAATCNRCGYRWFLTAAEMDQMAKWYDEYHEQCERDSVTTPTQEA